MKKHDLFSPACCELAGSTRHSPDRAMSPNRRASYLKRKPRRSLNGVREFEFSRAPRFPRPRRTSCGNVSLFKVVPFEAILCPGFSLPHTQNNRPCSAELDVRGPSHSARRRQALSQHLGSNLQGFGSGDIQELANVLCGLLHPGTPLAANAENCLKDRYRGGDRGGCFLDQVGNASASGSPVRIATIADASWKVRLIHRVTPDWEDLYDQLL